MLFRLEEDNTCFTVEWEEQNTSSFWLNGWPGEVQTTARGLLDGGSTARLRGGGSQRCCRITRLQ